MFLGLFVLSVSAAAWEECEPIDHSDAWEQRYGRGPDAVTTAQLRGLFESPRIVDSHAIHTDEEGASVETMTETHAVYPILPADLMATITSNERLTEFMPRLGEHSIVCHPADGLSRQRQRTEFGLLLFDLGTEYVIDVNYPSSGPDVFSSRWVLVDSLDDRMAYIYGSWYIERVELDGVPMSYVRHYVRTGLTTRVPGVRLFVERRIESEILNLFASLYEEATVQFGKVATR